MKPESVKQHEQKILDLLQQVEELLQNYGKTQHELCLAEIIRSEDVDEEVRSEQEKMLRVSEEVREIWHHKASQNGLTQLPEIGGSALRVFEHVWWCGTNLSNLPAQDEMVPPRIQNPPVTEIPTLTPLFGPDIHPTRHGIMWKDLRLPESHLNKEVPLMEPPTNVTVSLPEEGPDQPLPEHRTLRLQVFHTVSFQHPDGTPDAVELLCEEGEITADSMLYVSVDQMLDGAGLFGANRDRAKTYVTQRTPVCRAFLPDGSRHTVVELRRVSVTPNIFPKELVPETPSAKLWAFQLYSVIVQNMKRELQGEDALAVEEPEEVAQVPDVTSTEEVVFRTELMYGIPVSLALFLQQGHIQKIYTETRALSAVLGVDPIRIIQHISRFKLRYTSRPHDVEGNILPIQLLHVGDLSSLWRAVGSVSPQWGTSRGSIIQHIQEDLLVLEREATPIEDAFPPMLEIPTKPEPQLQTEKLTQYMQGSDKPGDPQTKGRSGLRLLIEALVDHAIRLDGTDWYYVHSAEWKDPENNYRFPIYEVILHEYIGGDRNLSASENTYLPNGYERWKDYLNKAKGRLTKWGFLERREGRAVVEQAVRANVFVLAGESYRTLRDLLMVWREREV